MAVTHKKGPPKKPPTVTVELDLAALSAKLQAQLAIANELMAAVTAADVALRKLQGLMNGARPSAVPDNMSTPSRFLAVPPPPAPARGKDVKRVPVKKHICANCSQTTTWDPCHSCGKPAPVMSSLMGRAPTVSTTDDEEVS